jgi:hypothetical protein
MDRERQGGEIALGPEAEHAVFSFFNESMPGMRARMATRKEDHGQRDPKSHRAIGGFNSGEAVDVVAYLENKPAIAIQVTASSNPNIQGEKMRQIMERPFVRLAEMTGRDNAVPRALIWLSPEQVRAFSQDPDFNHHEGVRLQILNSIELSLMFDMRQTQNPAEQGRLDELIGLLQKEKNKLRPESQELAA